MAARDTALIRIGGFLGKGFAFQPDYFHRTNRSTNPIPLAFFHINLNQTHANS
jgi:hypothetical protein